MTEGATVEGPKRLRGTTGRPERTHFGPFEGRSNHTGRAKGHQWKNKGTPVEGQRVTGKRNPTGRAKGQCLKGKGSPLGGQRLTLGIAEGTLGPLDDLRKSRRTPLQRPRTRYN